MKWSWRDLILIREDFLMQHQVCPQPWGMSSKFSVLVCPFFWNNIKIIIIYSFDLYSFLFKPSFNFIIPHYPFTLSHLLPTCPHSLFFGANFISTCPHITLSPFSFPLLGFHILRCRNWGWLGGRVCRYNFRHRGGLRVKLKTSITWRGSAHCECWGGLRRDRLVQDEAGCRTCLESAVTCLWFERGPRLTGLEWERSSSLEL